MMVDSESAEWMDAPMGPSKEPVPPLEEVKDSLPAELTAQRKALEAHIQAWFLERQAANSHACDLQDELARLQTALEGAEARERLRGKALRDLLTAVEQLGVFPDGIVARDARAAIDISPDEAREWEGA